MGAALSTVALAVFAASVRLEYVRADGAAMCITADELRAAVERRLGYAPFDDGAADLLQVTVTRKAPGFVARLVRTKGERELFTPRADCADLGEALAFAISVAIDPASMFAPPPAADAGAAPAVADSQVDAGRRPVVAVRSEPASSPAPAPPPQPIPLEAGAAVGAAWGLAPVASLTVRVEARLRWALFSVGLYLRTDVLGRLEFAGGSVSAVPIQAGLAPCLHWSALAACALVSGGLVVSSASGLPDAATLVSPVFQLGARLSYSLVIGRWQPFVYAEGGGTVARTSLFVGDTAAWTSPPAWGGGGLGFFFGPP